MADRDHDYWVFIASEAEGGDTYRLRVPGGWLYRVREWAAGEPDRPSTVALAFVPDALASIRDGRP